MFLDWRNLRYIIWANRFTLLVWFVASAKDVMRDTKNQSWSVILKVCSSDVFSLLQAIRSNDQNVLDINFL